MPPDQDFVDRALEALAPAGDITHKAMFGGVGIWEAGDMFALISSDTELYFKVDDDSIERYRAARCTQFRSMPYWSAPAGFLDDPEAFDDWVDEAVDVGHATAKRTTSDNKKKDRS